MRHPTFVLGAAVIGAATIVACTGDQGPPGDSALVETIAEPAGANCAFGGTKVAVGLDANGNGTLEPGEIREGGTSYLCNGAGTSSLVRTGPEPVGTNCPFGGTKIETGLDVEVHALRLALERIATAATAPRVSAPPGSAGRG